MTQQYFLKNIGKISTKVLTHPKRALQQSWKLAAKNIDNLKQLKKEFDELRQFKNGITESNTLPKIYAGAVEHQFVRKVILRIKLRCISTF